MNPQDEALSVTQEPDMSWFDIAIDNRGNAVILDYAAGWEGHTIEFYWEDTFASDPPKHLATGAYRWTGFKVGFWGEDDHLNVTGGEFIPHRLSHSTPGDAEVRKALGFDTESDASFNLQGAVDDLNGRYDPKDGGVIVRTIERAIVQIENVRRLLATPSGRAQEPVAVENSKWPAWQELQVEIDRQKRWPVTDKDTRFTAAPPAQDQGEGR